MRPTPEFRSVMLTCLLLLTMAIPSARAQETATPKEPPRPNILVILIDTLRADHLSCYGYQQPTSPNIDKLAEQGVLFERCYSSSSWTLPACTSLMSGLYCFEHGVNTWTSAIDDQLPWLPQLLQKAGYQTLGVSSNPFLTNKQGFGRGFDVFDDQTVLAAAEWSFPMLDSQYKACVLASTGATATRRAIELLNDRVQNKPFFLLVHYMDCHADYVPPAPWDKKFDPDYQGAITGHIQSQHFATNLPARDLQHVIAMYDGEIAHVDDQVGQLLEQLDALGLTQNTVVILTADHGEEFLEHGQWAHGHSLYEPAVHVPLIFRWPGLAQPRHRVTSAVSLVDVLPTALDTLKLPVPRNHHGMALTQALQGGEAPADRSLLMETQLSLPLLAVIRGRQKVISQIHRNPQSVASIEPLAVYDLTKDPKEQDQRVLSDERLSQLRDQIQSFLTATMLGSTASPNAGVPVPNLNNDSSSTPSGGKTSGDKASGGEQIERLRSLGYISE